jgi:hypothetical protein
LFARPGQRYFPLRSGAQARSTLRITRVDGERWSHARTENAERRAVRMRTARLLAADEDGIGTYYRFIGYAPRAGYSTHVRIVERAATWTLVACPEWHPDPLIRVASGALPDGAGHGDWLNCRADLGADVPARVQPHDFALVDEELDPARYRAGPAAPPSQEPADTPEAGPGCGDIVVFPIDVALPDAVATVGTVYVSGHRPELSPGSRAYLRLDDGLLAWRTVKLAQALPNGTRIVLEGPCHAVEVPVAVGGPDEGIAVVAGERVRQAWAWRTWRRADEVARG